MIMILDKIVIVIYAMIIYATIENLFWSARPYSKTERRWVTFFNVSLLIQSFVFIFMQIAWLMNPYYPKEDPSFMTAGWSVYNWLSSITLLVFAKLIHIYTKWSWKEGL